jgi:hypothetical protein
MSLREERALGNRLLERIMNRREKTLHLPADAFHLVHQTFLGYRIKLFLDAAGTIGKHEDFALCGCAAVVRCSVEHQTPLSFHRAVVWCL